MSEAEKAILKEIKELRKEVREKSVEWLSDNEVKRFLNDCKADMLKKYERKMPAGTVKKLEGSHYKLWNKEAFLSLFKTVQIIK